MKLKRALVGFVGATAIVVPTLAGVSACTFTRNNWECPIVAFEGDETINPNAEGAKTAQLAGFKILDKNNIPRGLYKDETMEVELVKQDTNKNDEDNITATLLSVDKNGNFSVKFDVTVQNPYANKEFAFKLNFHFKYGQKSGTYNLDNTFVFKYTGEWQPNWMQGTFKAGDGYTAEYIKPEGEEGFIGFEINDLSLERALENNESIDVETNYPDKIVCYSKTINYSTKCSFKFKILSHSRWDNYKQDFNICFKFKINGEANPRKTQWTNVDPDERFTNSPKVYFNRDYVDPEVRFAQGVTNSFTANGTTTYSFTDGTLEFNRTLSDTYDETLELSLTDENGNPVDDELELGYEYDKDSIYHVTITYIGEDPYVEKDYSLKFHYEIWEQNQPEGEESKGSAGDIPFNFSYKGVWLRKEVAWNGTSAQQNFNSGETGKRDFAIPSFTRSGEGEIIQGNYYFWIDKPLDEKESLTVILNNVDTEENPLELVSSTPEIANITIGEGDEEHEIALVNFGVRYRSDWFTQERLEHEGGWTKEFRLQFQFTVESSTGGLPFTYTQDELAQTFSLHYSPEDPDSANYLVPTIGTSYKGANRGDTIIKIEDGGLKTRAFNSATDEIYYGEETENMAVTTPADSPVTVMAGAEGGEYEHGVKFTNGSSSYSLYLIIDASKVEVQDADKIIPFEVTLTFHFKYKPTGQTYTKDVTTTLIYDGFSTKLTDYIKARTLPIGMYYQVGSTIYPRFISAFILGDATPSDYTDYKFYIATSWDEAEIYDKCLENQGISNFRVGITDPTYAGTYRYITGYHWEGFSRITDYSEWMDACFYKKNYIYFKTGDDGIQWKDKSIGLWSTGDTNYGCSVRVAEVNFDTIFETFEPGTDASDPDLIAAYMNKLIKLQNYQRWYGHVNGVVKEPITDSAEDSERYTDFGMSGFVINQQDYWYSYPSSYIGVENASVATWADYSFKTTKAVVGGKTVYTPAFKYISSSVFRESYSNNYPMKTTNATGDEITYAYQGSPVYYGARDDEMLSCGVWNGNKYWGIESLFGSMLVTYDKDEPNDKVKLVGIFWGWPYNQSTSSSFTFHPYFDTFIDGDDNLLEEYLGEDPTRK